MPTRRDVARGAIAAGFALRASGARAAPDPLRRGWRRVGVPFHANPVVLPPRTQAEARQQMLWCRMLRIDGGYRIWCWTHDAPICRLFDSADPLAGTWKESAATVPSPPDGWDPTHFAAADVAWDPVTRFFYASPHSRRSQAEPDGRVLQLSFLLRSRDGTAWERLGERPMVPAGEHEQAANYGRFLTDGHGRLARVHGRVWWFYRSDVVVDGSVRYRLNAASSRDLRHWTPTSANPILPTTYDETGAGGLLGIGTALWRRGRVRLVICRPGDGRFDNVVHTSRSPQQWPRADRGRRLWTHDLPGQPDGACLLLDGRRRLLVYSALGLDDAGQPQAQGWVTYARSA